MNYLKRQRGKLGIVSFAAVLGSSRNYTEEHCVTSLKMAAKETKLSIEWYKWRAQVKREPLYRYLIMTPEILE